MIKLRPEIARAARSYTGLTHIELGAMAGVASRTVFKLEDDGSVTDESLEKILRVLKHRGVTMVHDENGNVTGLSFADR